MHIRVAYSELLSVMTHCIKARSWGSNAHSQLSGAWSSVTVRGTRPPPAAGFTLTSIDDYRALFFGGKEGEHLQRISDLYLIDFQTMVHSNVY